MTHPCLTDETRRLHTTAPSLGFLADGSVREVASSGYAHPMAGDLVDRGRLHKKANEALEQNLVPGETVEVIITGPSNQAIIGTSRRAFVYKKGFMAGASFGSELTTWNYRNLGGVQLHTGMMTGAVVLQASGQSGASTSYWKNKDSDPYKTPNAIPIVRPWDQAQTGVARLRELVDAAHRTEAAAAPTAVPVEPAMAAGDAVPGDEPSSGQLAGGTDERHSVQLLRDLAELRDAGILSNEEFETKKAEVLKRL